MQDPISAKGISYVTLTTGNSFSVYLKFLQNLYVNYLQRLKEFKVQAKGFPLIFLQPLYDSYLYIFTVYSFHFNCVTLIFLLTNEELLYMRTTIVLSHYLPDDYSLLYGNQTDIKKANNTAGNTTSNIASLQRKNLMEHQSSYHSDPPPFLNMYYLRNWTISLYK